MSFEAIQKITEAEQSGRTRKQEAIAEAKRIAAEAERMGEQMAAQARAAAEESVKAMMVQAGENAARRAEQAQTENAAHCEALKNAARQKLDEAAELIVKKVGKS